MAMATLIKEKHLIVAARLEFRGSVHYRHDREHGSMQADMVLELRILHLAKAKGSDLRYWVIS